MSLRENTAVATLSERPSRVCELESSTQACVRAVHYSYPAAWHYCAASSLTAYDLPCDQQYTMLQLTFMADSLDDCEKVDRQIVLKYLHRIEMKSLQDQFPVPRLENAS